LFCFKLNADEITDITLEYNVKNEF